MKYRCGEKYKYVKTGDYSIYPDCPFFTELLKDADKRTLPDGTILVFKTDLTDDIKKRLTEDIIADLREKSKKILWFG